MVDDLREVTFPTAMRGYDREAVDAYVERVNRVIAELEISRSPESAVKHAVAQVSEETRGILERAHEAAEEITAKSRSRADDRLQQAEREAAEVRAQAEARVRELDADAEAIWNERRRLLEEVRHTAEELDRLAAAAHERYPEVPEIAAGAEQLNPGDVVEPPEEEPYPKEEAAADDPPATERFDADPPSEIELDTPPEFAPGEEPESRA
jgi:DivIVA domain-containing protein